MQRAFLANASPTPMTMPAGLQTGYMTDQGLGTIPGPWWFHTLTEELANAIIAGGLSLDAAATNQLATVITNLINKIVSTSAMTLPFGAIVPWTGSGFPTGWIQPVGNIFPATGVGSYPNLTAALVSGALMWNISDASFAANPGRFSLLTRNPDGSYSDSVPAAFTFYRVPDLRGLIVKGHHGGSGTYTTDAAAGRFQGSYQGDIVGPHTHQYWDIWYRESGGLNDQGAVGGGTGSSSTDGDNASFEVLRTTVARNVLENLVRNVSLNWIMRAA